MSALENYAADDLLTIEEAAALLKIQPKPVQRAIWRGTLPTVEIDAVWPHSRRRLRRAAVEAYAANRETWKGKNPWPRLQMVH